MQRFQSISGTDYIGREALLDTMGDLFVDGLGSAFMGIYMYIEVKKDSEWLNNLKLKNKKDESIDSSFFLSHLPDLNR